MSSSGNILAAAARPPHLDTASRLDSAARLPACPLQPTGCQRDTIVAPEGDEGAKAAPETPQGSFPLSWSQEGLWLLGQLAPASTENLCLATRITGSLPAGSFERAVNTLIRRHEVLRTVIIVEAGHPRQRVLEPQPIEVVPVGVEDTPLDELLRREMKAPFVVGDAPKLRAHLVRTGPDEHVGVLTLHPLIADSESIRILSRELATLTGAAVTGSVGMLPALPLQFRDHAVRERELLSGGHVAAHLEFWKTHLQGRLSPLDLPYDHPRTDATVAPAGIQRLALTGETAAHLRALQANGGATVETVTLAAFQAVLHRWTGQLHFALMLPADPRRHAGTQALVGCCASAIPIRSELDGNPTFTELVGRVQSGLRSACEHDVVPSEALMRELKLERGSGRTPLTQIAFGVEHAEPPVDVGPLRFEPLAIDPNSTRLELALAVIESPTGTELRLTYDTTLFNPTTAERLLRSVIAFLERAVAHPGSRIGELPIVPPDEARLLARWNETDIPYEHQLSVAEAFERQAARTPDAVALVHGEESWTYRRLEQAAERLAATLREKHVGPDSRVGVYLRRTPRLIIGMLGVLKAGGAYVPMDPAYPEERIAFILEDAGLHVLVTEEELVATLPPQRPACVLMAADGAPVGCPDVVERASVQRARPEDLAYVIYTSGSTGRPKGVCIPQRAVMAFVAWAGSWYSAAELGGVFFSTSACFDVSVFEWLVPLCLGGRIVIGENILDVADPHVVSQGLTLVSGVPSAMTEVVRGRLLPRTVKTVNLAGEPCPQSLVDALYAHEHVERVYDVYGPTETTVYSVGGLRVAGGRPSIGRPLANERAYVLDAYRQPVPIGVRGELFIGGAKLARGYLERPDLTAERFVPDPFEAHRDPHARMYRTGDVVRWLADGTLEYLGRADRQVKIRGFRVEPGEIERVIERHETVKECAVIVREDPALGKSLVACLVLKDSSADPEAVRAYLETRVPEYLVPTAFVAVDALPLSPNGKLDVRALTALVAEKGAKGGPTRRYMSPRDAVEQKLVGVWEEVLGVSRVGIDDDFFDLGGHSLLAVRMAALVEERLGAKMPLSVLFRAPTIERLARAIREHGTVAPGTSLIDLQPEGDRVPIYWLHTLGGGAGAGLFRYQKLARHLGADQPSFGFIAPGEPPETLEEMAGQFVEELRAVRPKGPYIVGGYCFGGILAYEVARQLERLGAEVPLVIILEADPPNAPALPGIPALTYAAHVARTLPVWLAQAAQRGELKARAGRLWRRAMRRIQNVSAGSEVAPLEQISDYLDMSRYPEEFRAHARAHWDAMTRYMPGPYGGRIALFRTGTARLTRYLPEIAWRTVAPSVDVYRISGQHENVLEEPQVSEVAQKLRAALDALA